MGATPRAGVSRIELHPELGVSMMGYGARKGTAAARHDPLFVRALYVEAGGRLLLIEIDVCLIAVAQATARAAAESAKRGRAEVPAEVPAGAAGAGGGVQSSAKMGLEHN